MKAQLEQSRIFNTASSFNKLEIHEYYQNEPKFNGIYSRNNLPKIKDGEYVINLSEYKSIGIHLLALHVNGNNRTASYDVIYFDNFGI